MQRFPVPVLIVFLKPRKHSLLAKQITQFINLLIGKVDDCRMATSRGPFLLTHCDLRKMESSRVYHTFDFRTLTAGSRWNEPVLKAVFHQGLNAKALKELACHNNVSLDSLKDLSIHLDNLNRNQQPCLEAVSPVPPVDQGDPMQFRIAKLCPIEH